MAVTQYTSTLPKGAMVQGVGRLLKKENLTPILFARGFNHLFCNGVEERLDPVLCKSTANHYKP